MTAKKPPKTDEPEAPKEEFDYGGYVSDMAVNIWSHDDTGHLLTIEEQLFCRSYIIDRNPVAACRRLNYAGENDVLKRRAAKMLANPEVQACVDTLAKRMMERLEVTADSVQRQIAAVAFFDPRGVMQFDSLGVSLLNSRYWTADQIAAVKSIKQGKDGVELVFYDRLRAAEMLAKQLGVQPEDDAAATIAAMKAGADMVMDKVFQVFDRTVPDDPVPAFPVADD